MRWIFIGKLKELACPVLYEKLTDFSLSLQKDFWFESRTNLNKHYEFNLKSTHTQKNKFKIVKKIMDENPRKADPSV